jgi:hypothetical protein
MAAIAPFSARARGGRPFRRPSRAGDTPTWSRHAVLVRWYCRHVAGHMLDVGLNPTVGRVTKCHFDRNRLSRNTAVKQFTTNLKFSSIGCRCFAWEAFMKRRKS